jgi:hypothetical protein
MKLYSFRQKQNVVKIIGDSIRYDFFYVYYGVLSPFSKDFEVLSTSNRKEAIYHTEKDVAQVYHLLKKHRINFELYEIENKTEKLLITLNHENRHTHHPRILQFQENSQFFL